MSDASTTKTPETVYWRSLGQLQDTPEFREMVAREFPAGAEEAPDDVSRRSFLTAVAASAALASLTSCRKPVTRILPFNKRPADFTPGIPHFYATTLSRSGYGLGVLVRSSDGRPTKIEGNPLHPDSLGGSDARLQAELLQIYDPSRSAMARGPAAAHADHAGDHGAGDHGGGDHGGGHDGHGAAPNPHAAYTEFLAFWEGKQDAPGRGKLAELAGKQGAGLHIVLPASSSPSLHAMVQKTADAFPQARFYHWNPIHDDKAREGSKAAFGRALESHVDYTKADVVVSFDCDFLAVDGNSLRNARLWADRRRAPKPGAPVPRLYVLESCYSTTGTSADNRLRMKPSEVAGAAMALAAELGVGKGGELASALDGKKVTDPRIAQIAADLQGARGRCAVVAGPRMPEAVHAVVHAINAALDNHGKTITFTPVPDAMQQGAVAGLVELEQAAANNKVDVLVCLDVNPVYDAPADIDFAAIVKAAKHSIHVGLHDDETGHLCQWHFPIAHELESWGDLLARDGTLSLRQPLLAPLYEGVSAIEFLALLGQQPGYAALEKERDGSYGYQLVRQHWQTASGAADFESWWLQTLHDGVFPGSRFQNENVQIDAAGVAKAVRDHAPLAGFEIELRACPKMWDGRYANNTWMQELPDPLTKVTWDNAALIGPRTAQRLGVENNGDILSIQVEGRRLDIAAWVLPGHAEECASIFLGWGRHLPPEFRIAHGTGFDGYKLRSKTAPWILGNATVQRGTGTYPLVCTQEHGTMAGRALVREATAEQYREHPDWAPAMSPLARAAKLKGKTEADLNQSLWEERGYLQGNEARDEVVKQSPYQWGMVIDLNVCTGCSACVVACVAENNIPMVGKQQVARNREMFWIRTDRYFASQPGNNLEVADNPRVSNMPVPCMQCENAPCETVCPVAATMHSPDGLNDMAYNRCIGTRYCSNNCPYKVRRFNYLDYTSRVPATKQMAFNPDVTVRSRGVMEKCTYCVQRINAGRIAARMTGTKVGDGKDENGKDQVRVVPACAQACPTQAITFGNIIDTSAKVAQLRTHELNYALLSEMNNKPRTTYLGRVLNPNELTQG